MIGYIRIWPKGRDDKTIHAATELSYTLQEGQRLLKRYSRYGPYAELCENQVFKPAMRSACRDEFKCKCGCSLNKMNPDMLALLDDARNMSSHPFVITSGYRCKDHNFNVGGSATSSHLKGLAVDIATPDSRTRWEVISSLIQAGFRRLGVAKNFVHVDLDHEAKTPFVIWYYK